ncbi:chromosome partitioning protein [Pusillimonas sp. T7-7]|uniref:ParB/RepB/Spo0J family partition protein n=1 Tax=Pusillimonas sp. (strain T7-7) TaxID=1007105 RepID=UPI0002084995|nr:ParB/RepB/Spo0J family partition protein [Pusillimonas sp. T7-7]AEC18762.1 chromosome partitioning protein [Pusillimonas sp. T7-7]
MTATKSLAAKPSGLDLAGLGDLASMLDTPVSQPGRPQMFDLDKIREDRNVRSENNPGFGKVPMAELTADVKQRGIKSPLSLRPDPERPGYYIINYGHRRYRSAKAAGAKQVPGFIDTDFNSFDQVKENLKHEKLTARELADFIGGKLAEGMSQAEIAEGLSKSKAFVSQHVALLNLPEPLAEAFGAGQIADVTVANELARAHRENPELVEQTLARSSESLAAKPVTREVAKALRKPAKKKAPAPAIAPSSHQPEIIRLENALSELLTTPVSIRSARGDDQVQLCIDARGWDHLNELLVRLGLGELLDA